MADKDLRDKYGKINKDLKEKKEDLLKEISKKLNIKEKDINDLYEDFYIFLEEEKEKITQNQNNAYLDRILNFSQEGIGYKFTDLFNEKIEKFIDENKDKFKEYFNYYKELIDKSKFFSNEFGTYQANVLAKAIKDGFFNAKHKILLSTGEEIDKYKDFEKN